MVVATVWFALVTWLVWAGLDWALGRSLPAQIVAVGGGLAAGAAVYARIVLSLEIPEAQQIKRLLGARLHSARA
jgi:putative peptidoglycan lipid II flippase